MKIQLFSIGKFAEDISYFLKKNTENIRITHVNGEYPELDEFVQEAEMFVVLSSQPCVEFCKKLENYAYSIHAKFLPIISNQPMITIGPLSNTGEGVCFHCFVDRVMQHSPIAAVQNSVNEFYNHHIVPSNIGFHPADVEMLGNWLLYTIQHNLESLEAQVFNFNTYSRYGYKSGIIGVHGCERCCTQEEATRSYIALENMFTNERNREELIK